MANRLKVTVVGASLVGKSSLIRRIELGANGASDETPTSTIGLEYFTVEFGDVSFGLVDTPGTKNMRAYARDAAGRADVVLVVYDLTSKHSFDIAHSWVNELFLEQNCIIVGNKLDATMGWPKVRQEKAQALARMFKHGKAFEVSAKTGEGVNELLTHLKDHFTPENEISIWVRQDGSRGQAISVQCSRNATVDDVKEIAGTALGMLGWTRAQVVFLDADGIELAPEDNMMSLHARGVGASVAHALVLVVVADDAVRGAGPTTTTFPPRAVRAAIGATALTTASAAAWAPGLAFWGSMAGPVVMAAPVTVYLGPAIAAGAGGYVLYSGGKWAYTHLASKQTDSDEDDHID